MTGRRSSARISRFPELTPAREARIVRELAAQLEDFYRDALARGASDAEADAFARGQIPTGRGWRATSRSADRRHVRPRLDRVAADPERIADTHPQGGAARCSPTSSPTCATGFARC